MQRREITKDEYLRLAVSLAKESRDFFPSNPLSTLGSSEDTFYIITFDTMEERDAYIDEWNASLVRFFRRKTSYKGPIQLLSRWEGR